MPEKASKIMAMGIFILKSTPHVAVFTFMSSFYGLCVLFLNTFSFAEKKPHIHEDVNDDSD